MSMTAKEAARALDDIEGTAAKTRILSGYNYGAPWLILWGLVWLIANTLTALYPRYGQMIWPICSVAGAVASILLALRPSPNGKPRAVWRNLVSMSAVFAFFYGTFFILHPHSGAQVNAVISLFVGTAYALRGLWQGWRIFVLGLALMVLTMTGYLYFPEYYSLWMGVLGGGALILGGLWLKTA